jgi:hypothetical protein
LGEVVALLEALADAVKVALHLELLPEA